MISKSVFYLQYYCGNCWMTCHSVMDPNTGEHNPLMRNSKNSRASAKTIRKLPPFDRLKSRPEQPYGDNDQPNHRFRAV